MFSFFRRWRQNRRRMIYRFWDGQNFRRVDPIAVHLRLQSHPKFLVTRDLKLVDSGDREATEITAAAVCDCFEVQPYDTVTGRGLTVGERLGLLADFYFWIELQKKSIRHLQTSQSSTAPTSPASNSPTMSATPPSSSCASDPTCAAPITCDTHLTAPSPITSETTPDNPL